MPDAEILLLDPVLPIIEATLSAHGLGVVRLWEAPDRGRGASHSRFPLCHG